MPVTCISKKTGKPYTLLNQMESWVGNLVSEITFAENDRAPVSRKEHKLLNKLHSMVLAIAPNHAVFAEKDLTQICEIATRLEIPIPSRPDSSSGSPSR